MADEFHLEALIVRSWAGEDGKKSRIHVMGRRTTRDGIELTIYVPRSLVAPARVLLARQLPMAAS